MYLLTCYTKFIGCELNDIKVISAYCFQVVIGPKTLTTLRSELCVLTHFFYFCVCLLCFDLMNLTFCDIFVLMF